MWCLLAYFLSLSRSPPNPLSQSSAQAGCAVCAPCAWPRPHCHEHGARVHGCTGSKSTPGNSAGQKDKDKGWSLLSFAGAREGKGMGGRRRTASCTQPKTLWRKIDSADTGFHYLANASAHPHPSHPSAHRRQTQPSPALHQHQPSPAQSSLPERREDDGRVASVCQFHFFLPLSAEEG